MQLAPFLNSQFAICSNLPQSEQTYLQRSSRAFSSPRRRSELTTRRQTSLSTPNRAFSGSGSGSGSHSGQRVLQRPLGRVKPACPYSRKYRGVSDVDAPSSLEFLVCLELYLTTLYGTGSGGEAIHFLFIISHCGHACERSTVS